MDFCGITKHFPGGRRLTPLEKAHRLHQKTRLDIAPDDQRSVIEMNSTYLDAVDKWYPFRGAITALSLIVTTFALGLYGAMVQVSLNRTAAEPYADDGFVLTLIACLIMPLLAYTLWMLRKDSFGYTHYPLRFNRRTRTVHVFREDGSVLTVPWDDVAFTLTLTVPGQNVWNIMGHVLEKDGVTVRESFALSVSDFGASPSMLLRSHWEFIRRYMQEGPQAVSAQVQFCLPIARERESFMVGLRRLLANSATKYPILWPFTVMLMAFDLLFAPFRFIAMQTSKIPAWPAEVLAQSSIEPDDPFAIEGNAKGRPRAVFPYAAQAASLGSGAAPVGPSSR